MLGELGKLRDALHAYITATYHLSDPVLIARRDALLREPGQLAGAPFVESSARYRTDRAFEDLAIPPPVRELLSQLGEHKVVFDPPYNHQAEALERVVGVDMRSRRDLVVTTGTGSGKTECFLLPILGRLADEASTRPQHFRRRALRGLVLYPMNALVNDQLGRLRTLFAHEVVTQWFGTRVDRPAKFARYTGKTLYPGPRKDAGDAKDALKSLDFYLQLEDREAMGDQQAAALVRALRRQGKWPAKHGGVRSWYGRDGQSWRDRARERAKDPELFLRHEVQEDPPDLLVTNYSMLEYMLLRPIERGIFERTRQYLADTGESFVLVLDEAHLYRGVTGVEVGMLVRRLRQRLQLPLERLRVIATSASFSAGTLAAEFVGDLSGKPASGFVVLRGEQRARADGPAATSTTAALVSLGRAELTKAASLADAAHKLRSLLPIEGLGTPLGRALVLRRVGSSEAPVGLRLRCLSASFTECSVDLRLGVGMPLSPPSEAVMAVMGAEVTEGADDAAVAFDDAPEAVLVTVSASEAVLHPERHPFARVFADVLAPVPEVAQLADYTSGVAEQAYRTLGPAKDLPSLAAYLAPTSNADVASEALGALLELCPLARGQDDLPLLAARLHCFFRGLPGLWACVDAACSALGAAPRTPSVGKIFGQPRTRCDCGSRVYEIFSCRDCGQVFLQAHAEDPRNPRTLFASPGDAYGGRLLSPMTLALDHRGLDQAVVRPASLELKTGQLRQGAGAGLRPVFLSQRPWRPLIGRTAGTERLGREQPGLFEKCPYCGEGEGRAVHPIQDHATSGDEPFLEVVRRQVLLQPARLASSTPLRGRKALLFSDSRQVAERIAARLQRTTLLDAVRPLLLLGLEALERALGVPVALDRAYLAVLVGAVVRDVTPRPEGDDRFVLELEQVRADLFVGRSLRPDLHRWLDGLQLGLEDHDEMADAITRVIHDRHTGAMALALAAPFPVSTGPAEAAARARLPAPRGRSVDGAIDWSSVSEDRAIELLITLWVQLMVDATALRVPIAPVDWVNDSRKGPRIVPSAGAFTKVLPAKLPAGFREQHLAPGGVWRTFLTERYAPDQLLLPAAVGLRAADSSPGGWARCTRCSRVQPLVGEIEALSTSLRGTCRACKGRALVPLVPGDAAWNQFVDRKGLYRAELDQCRSDPQYSPHPLHTAAHTAGISQSSSDAATGRAEEYELRFQDVRLRRIVNDRIIEEPPIDVLSVTTTMEVGIDIGSLTAVALRNVPPGRANYQQRAGRAGRRGSSLSMVLTWCSADSHDRAYFLDPRRMISGEVPDPKLVMDNHDILRRHLFAAVLSAFQRDRPTANRDANVLASLGTVESFAGDDPDGFTYVGLQQWLVNRRGELHGELLDLLPTGVSGAERLVDDVLSTDLLTQLKEHSVAPGERGDAAAAPTQVVQELIILEERLKNEPDPMIRGVFEDRLRDRRAALAAEQAELSGYLTEQGDDLDPGQAAPRGETKLLEHLFARGLLPSYAFPTQVVAFHIFKSGTSAYRPEFAHQPQRGLAQALSGYAPGRQVWVDKAAWQSFALYSPFQGSRALGIPGDFEEMKRHQRRYLECRSCGYVSLLSPDEIAAGVERTCEACQQPARQGPAMRWIRPPGFAHPTFMAPDRSGAEIVASRATAARLSAYVRKPPTPATAGQRIEAFADRQDLIWTNSGPDRDEERRGFRLCLSCGLAEPAGMEDGPWGQHERPYPAKSKSCTHRYAWTNVALGTTQRTDIAVLRLRIRREEGVELNLNDDATPRASATRTALTTLTQALVAAAVDVHDLEPGDLQGAYRIAMTPAGQQGKEIELYLYDAAVDGAGHSRRVAEDLPKILDATRMRLVGCKNETCQAACYDCLCSYRNQFDHGYLDRRLGLALLDYCRDGAVPTLAAEDMGAMLGLLADALKLSGHEAERRDDHLVVGGTTVRLRHPLRAASSAKPEDVEIDAWLVLRNVPSAVSQALAQEAGPLALPDSLTEVAEADPGAIPVLDWDELCKVRTLDGRPLRFVRLGVPHADLDDIMVVRIPDRRLTERLMGGTHYLVARRAPDWAASQYIARNDDLSRRMSRRHLLLIRVDDGRDNVFGGVQQPLAVGRVERARDGRLKVSFDASLPGADSTFFRPEELMVAAFVEGFIEASTGGLRWLGE